MIKTGRFGSISFEDSEIISIPHGILGFPEYTKYCLVDPGDDTLILWLQSIEDARIAFPVLEPKVFKPDYAVRLSGLELRELKLGSVNQSAVFSILTIPEDVTQMSANLKAPVVVNLRERVARQVVLQENDYGIRHLMLKELRAHLATIAASGQSAATPGPRAHAVVSPKNIPPSLTVRSLRPEVG